MHVCALNHVHEYVNVCLSGSRVSACLIIFVILLVCSFVSGYACTCLVFFVCGIGGGYVCEGIDDICV